MMKFSLGRLVATKRVADLMGESKEFGEHVSDCLKRYITCDWGEMCEEDKQINDKAVKFGNRILASYENAVQKDWKIWIVTESDRSVTTVLFPEDY